MLSASSDQGQSGCHFPSLLVGEESSGSRLLILLMGKKPAKSFKRKMFHVLTVFFRLVRHILIDPVIRAIGFSTSVTS
jgi:hypothetical protein